MADEQVYTFPQYMPMYVASEIKSKQQLKAVSSEINLSFFLLLLWGFFFLFFLFNFKAIYLCSKSKAIEL